MARRQRKQSGFELLVSSPWWVSLLLGTAAYVLLRFALPTAVRSQPLLAGVGSGLQQLAPLVFGICLLCAAISAIRSALMRVAQRRGDAPQARTGIARARGPRGHSHTRLHSPPVATHHGPASVTAPDTAAADAGLADEALLPNPGATTMFVPSRRHAWNVEALRTLEWKRFELLCAWYYESFGLHVVTQEAGADGGVDLWLHKTRDDPHPMALGQCKAWQSQVGVAPVRELRGVMAHANVARGLFLATSGFTDEAKTFAAQNQIQLIDGEGFVAKLLALEKTTQQDLLRRAFSGDFSTPTCPTCGVKLLPRNSVRNAFWGCVNFPRCRFTLPRAAQ